MYGSFIQSHWPCSTLWPISMFSRIFAIARQPVPAVQATLEREPSSSARPATAIWRCSRMTPLMYRRSRSPRSARTWSWMASNSRASSASWSSLRWAYGCVGAVMGSFLRSEFDRDPAFGTVHAGAHDLVVLLADGVRAQVPDPAFPDRQHARVADPDPAAEGHGDARVLARDEDRGARWTVRVEVAVREPHGAARALGVRTADDRLEPLVVQPAGVAVAFPVRLQRVEQLAGTAGVGFPLVPVRAQGAQVAGGEPAVPAGDAQLEAEALELLLEGGQLFAEGDPVRVPRRMHVDDVAQAGARGEVAQHAHHRRDAAAGGDEQQAAVEPVRQGEGPFDLAEPHDLPGADPLDQERRAHPAVDLLGGDRDEPGGAVRARRQRVRAPVVDAVDDDAQPHVLPGPVPDPVEARPDQHGGRAAPLGLDAFDSAAQLPGRPQGVEQLEVGVRAQGR